MTHVLDNWMEAFATELTKLPRKSFALFFAYLAERLIPLYFSFEQKHKWGDAIELRQQLDFVWSALEGTLPSIPTNSLERLEAITPSGERFDAPDSTYAQDSVICVDAAVRALIPDETVDGNWIEYGVEPIKTKTSIEECGFSSIEGAPREEWETRLMKDPDVADFLADCEKLLKRLAADSNLNLSHVRAEARSKTLPAEAYIANR